MPPDRSTSRERDFAAFYDATWGRTVACAYAVTGDLAVAEELAQEAYTRAWSRWSRLRGYDEPAAWVRQVATRLAVSSWRRRRTATAWLGRQRPPEPARGPDETSVALVRALRELPEAQRRALVLHHLAGLPVAEVAAVERCPEGTVKARLSRGRAALAVLLDPSNDTPDNTDAEPSHA
ncbi:SigE family RNA polymerase sigma factor [Nocardioides marinquilinus]|uniref:SigE family RNA polymerase sigma factor n=1 Tax=Nocardioides marinquilinus TaxID=1210400 RepID=A0ABP9PKI5_9ACTN